MSGDAKVKKEVYSDSELSFNLENAVSRFFLEPKIEKNSGSEFMCIQDTINSKLVPYVPIAEKKLELVKWCQKLIEEEVQNQTSMLLADKTKAETTLATRDAYYESRLTEYRTSIKEKEIDIRYLRMNEKRLRCELQFQTETALDFKNRFYSLRGEYLNDKRYGEELGRYAEQLKLTIEKLHRKLQNQNEMGKKLRATADSFKQEIDELRYQDYIWKSGKWIPSYLVPVPLSDDENESELNPIYNSNSMPAPVVANDILPNSSTSNSGHQEGPVPSISSISEEDEFSSAESGSTSSDENDTTVLENPEMLRSNTNITHEMNGREKNQSSVFDNTVLAAETSGARFGDFNSHRSDTSSCWISMDSDGQSENGTGSGSDYGV